MSTRAACGFPYGRDGFDQLGLVHDLAPLLNSRLLCTAEHGQLLATPSIAAFGNTLVELTGIHARFQGDLERLVRTNLMKDGRYSPSRKTL
jgi:hypothetical protein